MNVSEEFKTKETRKGTVAVFPKIPRGVKPWVARLRKNGFHYKACSLFNSLPKWVREVKGSNVEKFKQTLNRYLSVVPDRPRDASGGYYPDPYDQIGQTYSNSLVHWGVLLREIRPEWDW